MRILAVDDNADNIQLISDILDDMQHDVLCAYDGFQALAMASEQMPDLILLDVNMPGMSGFDVVTELKAHEQTSQIPIIMLTALGGIDDRVAALGLGADDYLTKPFSPRELMARIETRLRAKSHTDQLRTTRKLLQNMFERFVSPSVVQRMLADPDSVNLGGTLQDITVLFADLQGFTAMSEVVDPQLLLNVLNRHHEVIVDAIQTNGGTVDKFMGDGVMALYNTPLELDHHALRAVKTACQIRDNLLELHAELPTDFPTKINVGIHSGRAVVGNVGTPQIMDFTAIGDTVNVASRLQGLSVDGQILVSEATFLQVEAYVVAEPLGPVVLKNRREPVMTYAIETIDERVVFEPMP